MTVREILARRIRAAMLVVYGCLALFLLSLLVSYTVTLPEPILAAILIVGMIGFGATFVVWGLTYFFVARCPCCKQMLAPIVFQHGAFSVSKKIRCCPYCQVTFDSEYPEQLESQSRERPNQPLHPTPPP